MIKSFCWGKILFLTKLRVDWIRLYNIAENFVGVLLLLTLYLWILIFINIKCLKVSLVRNLFLYWYIFLIFNIYTSFVFIKVLGYLSWIYKLSFQKSLIQDYFKNLNAQLENMFQTLIQLFQIFLLLLCLNFFNSFNIICSVLLTFDFLNCLFLFKKYIKYFTLLNIMFLVCDISCMFYV